MAALILREAAQSTEKWAGEKVETVWNVLVSSISFNHMNQKIGFNFSFLKEPIKLVCGIAFVTIKTAVIQRHFPRITFGFLYSYQFISCFTNSYLIMPSSYWMVGINIDYRLKLRSSFNFSYLFTFFFTNGEFQSQT